uniref:Hook microtubule tethering protein 2 n=1 Tax=Nothobranchius furzeri TaxID=105023 RepID=A0A8C6KHL0_NOTFU
WTDVQQGSSPGPVRGASFGWRPFPVHVVALLVFDVLINRDPAWFNETWLGRIKEESEDNWRLKVSNLKKILKITLEYYHDVLGHQVSDEHLPDVSLIGEMGDATELGKLMQLVLGCAISCEKKEEQIQQIMTLEESVQHVVMTAIQEVSERPHSSSRPFLSFFLLCVSRALRHENSQSKDLSQTLEEKSSLQAEIRSLKERLSDPLDPPTITGKKLLLLQSQLEQLQEENDRLESSRDDLRAQAELLEREVRDLQHRMEELTSLAHEAQALKDEMDILRHSSDRVNQLEALVETYKRKLEDLGDLRRQVRLLEERNTVYMQRTCELEEELRRANAIRSQLDSYKRQAHELHSKHSAEAMKAEKWQFEYKNLHDKYEALLKDKERLISERDALREANDELRCAQVQQGFLGATGEPGSPRQTLSHPPSCVLSGRETVVRLQGENKMLCAQEETCRQKLVEVESELEETRRSAITLETQNRLNQQQISDLRSQVEELQKALQQQGSKNEDSSLLKKKLEEHLERFQITAGNLLAKKIDELQEVLRKKDEDMKQMEERYKRYMEKARTVIQTLDPKQPAGTPDIQALKNQLTEKERRIQHLECDFEKSRSRHDQEEKLIITAWYNMGMALHQKVSAERRAPSNQPMSFLAQQRQSTMARRGLTRPHPR